MRKIHNVLQYAVTDQGLGNRTYMDKGKSALIASHEHALKNTQNTSPAMGTAVGSSREEPLAR
jgi:hypothetical protein